jgi:phospholipid/cholesterol/gamma-HCH transport system ATP-binding protein
VTDRSTDSMPRPDARGNRPEGAAAGRAAASAAPSRIAPAAAPSAAAAPAQPRAIIRFEDVHFWQGTLKVLDGVSFEIPEGQVTVVLGPSGTGKSTLLWLMLGLWKPDAGRIFIDDEDTTTFDEEKWKEVRQRLAMVFQENALFDSLTVGENVGYGLFLSPEMSEEEIESRVRETLTLVGLDPDQVIDRNPEELSGGQKRRVAIARAIASCDPEIIFYDEPTTGLDPQTARTIGDLIIRLRDERGITAAVVTHEIGDALRVGDHFLLLDRGSVIYDGRAAGLLASSHPRVQSFLDPFVRGIEKLAPQVAEAVK